MNQLIYFRHRDTVTVCISPSPTVYKIIQDLPWSGCVHITSGPKTKVSSVTNSTISKFGILIDIKSVSISQNEIFGVTWIFQKVQVQIRTELGDSQPALTQSLVPVFKHPTGPTISLPYESSVGSMMQASAHKIEFPVTKVGEQSGKEKLRSSLFDAGEW